MDPLPPSILSCPHCQALYKRSSDFDENGMDHWSDGKVCIDITYNYYLDPVVRCTNCNQLFITSTARTQNKWGYNIPKDIKFHPALPLSIEDCQLILKDEDMLSSLDSVQADFWFSDSAIDPADKQTLRLTGEILMRMAILTKLNDLIRYDNKPWTPEEKKLYDQNANALLRLIPKQILTKELLLLKAELHRNKGQFLSSLLVLRKISPTASRFTRNRLIRLNLLLNRKLMRLNKVPFRRTPLGYKVKQLQYRIEDFFNSFRKK